MKHNKLFFTIVIGFLFSILSTSESNAQGSGTIIIKNETLPPSSGVEFNFRTSYPTFLTINSPNSIQGDYEAGTSFFGLPFDFSGLSGDIELIDPILGAPTPILNDLTGKIALIERGEVGFVTKVKNAQEAGAIAAIVYNSLSGGGVLNMGGEDPTITIPSCFISNEDGQLIKDALLSGDVNVTARSVVVESFMLQHSEVKIFNNVPEGSYSIFESNPLISPPYGYMVSAINIVDPSGGSSANLTTGLANIDLSDGETVEVTFINHPCTMNPSTADKTVNSQHTIQLDLQPLSDIAVEFSVIEGPNTGKSASVLTDENGIATFSYTGDGGVGNDKISANVEDVFTCHAEVTWNPIPPDEMIAELITIVDESDIHKGTKNSLSSSLENALKSWGKGNTVAAINQLEAFINKVEAQSGKKIDEGTADSWISDAQAINDAIQASLAKNGVIEELTSEEIIPEVHSLNQNYPNPFNPTTTISYSIPENEYVTLSIYDALGKEVAVLDNGFRTAGNYSHTFDASDLSSGMYFYTIRSGKFVETKKMILLK